MRRALVVAGVEFRALVRSRAFLFGLALPPLLGALGAFAARATRTPEANPAPRAHVAVVDRTGTLFGALEVAAGRHNETLGDGELRIVLQNVDPERGAPGAFAGRTDVRDGDVLAIVEIPADAAAVSAAPVRVRVVGRDRVRGALTSWLESALRDELRTRALRAPGVSPELRARLERTVVVDVEAPPAVGGEARGVAPDPDAAPGPTRALLDRLGGARRLAVTGPLAFVLFLVVSLSAAPLFQAVLEEKTSRVSEILISSISPFELMLGKLLGSLGACGIASAAYGGTLLAILALVFGAAIPPGLLALFAVFLVLSLLLWGALFLALGAACNDMKDAQNLSIPLLLIQVLPILFLSNVIGAPTSGLARFLSLFPPSAPVVMLIRLGHDPAPPASEVALSVLLLAGAALACVWAAGRVLRVGLLAQGRAASWREIARWARTG